MSLETVARLPADIAPDGVNVELSRCDATQVLELGAKLGLHHLAAQTLVRRGLGQLEAATAWLDVADPHEPEALPGAGEAAELIHQQLRAGTRIAVHGDYDVDGVCSTAILVRALAALGADVTWHVPSRFEDGYGLSTGAIDRFAADGVGLILAVDCGIGSVAEVAHARALGIEVVVCDHHMIGSVLPDATIVHPALGGYPDPYLCASAAAHKLASVFTTLAAGGAETLDDDLALVALATVCDVVPLRGENRSLVQLGVERLRTTQRPGLRELMRVARVDQLKVSASNLGFTLGPRINAAGRLHSADPAVELMLTSSERRAAELASELAGANDRRREIEREILLEAEAQASHQRDQFAIVVAGESWHPGVLGIIAGRLADRYNRPAIALSIDGATAAGSGRAGGRFDLHGGLSACAELLVRYGGHRAAAGLELDVVRLGAFRAMFVQQAQRQLTLDDLRPSLRIDAVAAPEDVSLAAVDALEAIGPFGAENPEPKILLSGTELVDVRKLGSSGQHFRLGVASQGTRSQAVAFRQDRVISAVDLPRPVDLVVELQRNEFNGREEAQAVVAALIERDRPAAQERWKAAFLRGVNDPLPDVSSASLDPDGAIDLRGLPLAAILAGFDADDSVAVVVNDPAYWDPLMESLAGCGMSASVVAYDDPAAGSGDFAHVVMAEPPPSPGIPDFGAAAVTIGWSDAALRRVLADANDLLLSRDHTVAAFRAIREAQEPSASVEQLLAQALPSARIAGRAVRALAEIGVVEVQAGEVSVESIIIVDSARTELDRSPTFRSYSDYREESQRWLRQLSAETKER